MVASEMGGAVAIHCSAVTVEAIVRIPLEFELVLSSVSNLQCQNLYKFAHYIISAVHKPSARGQLFNRFLQQKPHALVEELLFATTDFEFVCLAFDPVFVSDKHFIVVQHRYKPHQTPTQVALPQGVFFQPDRAVQRVCSASVLDACA